jgi:hypothetical protein
MQNRGERLPRGELVANLATTLSSLTALVALVVWLWSHVCMFPDLVWNDIRVAAAVGLAEGWKVFPTATDGVINTWTYGPLPLLVLWPASWASTASGALLTAAGINLGLILGTLALVCMYWPANDGNIERRMFARGAAFLISVAAWPEPFFAMYYADTIAIACGLLGNLALVNAKSTRGHWVAALLATAAVAAKQTALGIPLAQFLWLALTAGWRPAGLYVARCIVAGSVIAVAAITAFGWNELWFVLMDLPSSFAWFPEPWKRLWFVGEELVLFLVLPAIVMLVARRSVMRTSMLLPALAWACAIPLGIMALLKLGGRTNSLYSFVLWLPPVLTGWLAMRPTTNVRRLALPTAMMAVAALACARVLHAPRLPMKPQTAGHEESARLAARWPGQIWFPFHPLVTLYSEGRYYHDEDGLFVRKGTRWPLKPEHVAAHLPPALTVFAFRTGWSDWGVAKSMLPSNARSSEVGGWTLWTAAVEPPSR